MTRYLEDLNECTAPTTGDYLWIYDASAGSTDKDRKVNISEFALTGAANTFAAAQTIEYVGATLNLKATTGKGLFYIYGADNGTAGGGLILIGRNTNASTPAVGSLEYLDKSGTAWFVFPDDSGVMRIMDSAPISTTDTGGTVIGAQTSMAAAKYLYSELSPIDEVLRRIADGADAVRTFVYKSGAYNREKFEGVVTDYAPAYGVDRDEEHPAGKSLNEIQIAGDLLRAVAWLSKRVAELEQTMKGSDHHE